MQKAQNVLVGLKHTRLMIVDGVLLAEGFDDRLCFPQFVPGHDGKQMMLDLVVQPAIPKVDQGRTSDSAGGKHLAAEKVQRTVFVQNEHPFMVWSDDRTQVQAKKRLMDDNEQDHLPDVQAREQQAHIE